MRTHLEFDDFGAYEEELEEETFLKKMPRNLYANTIPGHIVIFSRQCYNTVGSRNKQINSAYCCL